MEKQAEAGAGTVAHRRLSQIKVIARLIEFELESAKGKEVTLDRDMLGNVLDTLEIYVEDFEKGRPKGRRAESEKQPVTRLN